MSKNIRKVIASTLLICSISVIMGTTNVKAATYDNASRGELSKLKVCRSTGSELELKGSFYGEEVKLSNKNDYYVELTNSEGIYMDAQVEGNGYVVKAFTSAAKDAEGHNVDDFIKIDSTTTNIYLRTYRSQDDYDDAFNNNNVTKCLKTYVIHVKKEAVEDSEKEENKDYPSLKGIYLSDGKIDFLPNKFLYDVYVNNEVKDLIVRAKPLDSDYLVEINGDSVSEDKNYEATVKLNADNNIIKIRVESDDCDETYTLNVIRGSENGKVDDEIITNGNSDKNKIQLLGGTRNSWVNKNGKYQYIDGTGQPLKQKWWFDINTGKNYYLDDSGYMKVGWLKYNNKWYYTDNSGAMQTGWVKDRANWYYLTNSGAMVTGWAEDTDGNWYYFGEDGAMVSDTSINGYRLDSDGKLIK